MSFDKDYPNRKDRRKPYQGSKNFDRSCRNSGSCDWRRNNRLKHHRIIKDVFRDQLADFNTSI